MRLELETRPQYSRFSMGTRRAGGTSFHRSAAAAFSTAHTPPVQKRRRCAVRVARSEDAPGAQARSPRGPRVAVTVQYDGTGLHGWERKPDAQTVQGILENAVSDALLQRVNITGASRTDAGTHAIAQVFHFDVPEGTNAVRNWRTILNRRLPQQVRVVHSSPVDTSFDARHSALSRRYRYTILNDPRPNAFLGRYAWHVYPEPLDVDAMDAAAALAVSEDLDVTAFRKAGCSSQSPLVSVRHASVVRKGDYLMEIDVRANRFVYGMMRLLAASLVDVGHGKLSVARFGAILQTRDRAAVRTSAPARGLCLMHVEYPAEHDIYAEGLFEGVALGMSSFSSQL